MKINEVKIGQKVTWKKQTGTVVDVTRCRVYVAIGGRLPEVVSARSLKPHVDPKVDDLQAAVCEMVEVGLGSDHLDADFDVEVAAAPKASRWNAADLVAAAGLVLANAGLFALVESIIWTL